MKATEILLGNVEVLEASGEADDDGGNLLLVPCVSLSEALKRLDPVTHSTPGQIVWSQVRRHRRTDALDLDQES